MTAVRSQNDPEEELVSCELTEWDEVDGAEYEKVSRVEEQGGQTGYYTPKGDTT